MSIRISAWSAFSPYGHGRLAFADGVRGGAPATPVSTKDEWARAEAHVVPDFDIVEQLGRKGTGSMDRASALAVATLRALQRDEHGSVASNPRTGPEASLESRTYTVAGVSATSTQCPAAPLRTLLCQVRLLSNMMFPFHR